MNLVIVCRESRVSADRTAVSIQIPKPLYVLEHTIV